MARSCYTVKRSNDMSHYPGIKLTSLSHGAG